MYDLGFKNKINAVSTRIVRIEIVRFTHVIRILDRTENKYK
jgi:hypothetical protein